jgi:hypothetical protein
MLLIISINIIVIALDFVVLELLDDKSTKAINDFCKIECK